MTQFSIVLAGFVGLLALLLVWALLAIKIGSIRHRRSQRREADALAELRNGWPMLDYVVGTRGHGPLVDFASHPITCTWPEASSWAETASQKPHHATAFVMTSDGHGYLREWVWTDGTLTHHEIRKARS